MNIRKAILFAIVTVLATSAATARANHGTAGLTGVADFMFVGENGLAGTPISEIRSCSENDRNAKILLGSKFKQWISPYPNIVRKACFSSSKRGKASSNNSLANRVFPAIILVHAARDVATK